MNTSPDAAPAPAPKSFEKSWSTHSRAAIASAREALKTWLGWDILVPLAISRVTLMIVGWLAMILLNHGPKQGTWEIGKMGNVRALHGRVSSQEFPLVNMWSRWDAGWYLDIAQKGYKFVSGKQSNLAFFPAYPTCLRIAHTLFHFHNAAWWLTSGIVVSNLALAVCLAYLFLLARMEFDEATARRAVIYLLIFPTTLFLSAVYAESVFLAFIVGSFYHARRRDWWIAGLLGCGATLSRPPGFLIFVALAAEYLLQCEWNWRKVRADVLALALIPLTLIAYFLYIRHSYGSATAAVEAQFSWGLGLPGGAHVSAASPHTGRVPSSPVDVGFTLLFAALALAIAFRLRASYAAYAVAYLIFICMWGTLESIPRYVLGIFPAFILLAHWGRNDAFHRAYVPISAGLAAFFMAVFAVWGWVA